MYSLLPFVTLFFSANAASFSTPTVCSTSTNVCPQVLGSPTIIANITDPSVKRDSCGSVRIGIQAFWTCRDTKKWFASKNAAGLATYSNSCGWTTFKSGVPNIFTDGPVGADSNGTNSILQVQGCDPTTSPLVYPIPSNECPTSGFCNSPTDPSPGTRWALWPNSPPMVTTSDAAGDAVAYTWIPNSHFPTGHNTTLLNPNPPCGLYKLNFTAAANTDFARPQSVLVNEAFWQSQQICFGTYGNVVTDGIAYLYGQNSARNTTLARVSVSQVETLSEYQYYNSSSGQWTNQMPSINDPHFAIGNATAGGQGTFYYSSYFSRYIWIGERKGQGVVESQTAYFYVTTSQSPEGPWLPPYEIYAGPGGSKLSYSQQAHPGLLVDESQGGIYVTWTQHTNGTAYNTPLVYLTWAPISS